PGSSGVDHEEGQNVLAGDQPDDSLDVLGEWGRVSHLAFVRESDAVVAGGVRVDACKVEYLAQYRLRLPDRLALVPGRVQVRDQVGDVGEGDFVHTLRAQSGRDIPDAGERRAVHVPGLLGHVNPARTPCLGGVGERQDLLRRLSGERVNVGQAQRGKLA